MQSKVKSPAYAPSSVRLGGLRTPSAKAFGVGSRTGKASAGRQKSKVLKEIGEFGLIERIKEWAKVDDKRVIVPLGDDAAVVKTSPQFYAVLTTDSLLEGAHFKLDFISPFELGYKALAASLSDIAAVAGVPRFSLISLGLKDTTELNFVQAFYKGFKKVAREYGLSLVGGDTFRSKVLILNVTVIGEVEPKLFRTRSEAKVGDKVLVTGSLGRAAAGLEIFLNPEKFNNLPYLGTLKKAYLIPKPRIAEARIASKLGARAMEDISDGLSTEICNVCQASRVGAKIFAEKIPVEMAVRKMAKHLSKSPLELSLNGGEDFELVFTAPPDKAERMKEKIFKKTKTKVTEVGELIPLKAGRKLILPDGTQFPLNSLGYNHFQSK